MSPAALADALLDGDQRALARAISIIEDRADGHRELLSRLHAHRGGASVVGVTGSPGTGKSTLVDKLARTYRDQGLTVGVIAVDPASPFSGGSVLGDRIRMASTAGDMDVFFRSMSARGSLGGLSAATADTVAALDAFGKDRIIVETVGAGQNEIDIVRHADTVAVLVPPESGDTVQMLKAGILEIGDVFVVNKADLAGVDRTVRDLEEMVHLAGDDVGSHRADDVEPWSPPVVETVATEGEGVDELVEVFDEHRDYLEASGLLERRTRERYADEIRTLLREDAGRLVEARIAAGGGIEAQVDRVIDGETTPYDVVDELIAPFERAAEDAAGR
ncbi:MAG: methylmalonyl Co-A mutase-associated GTPase MeaB [Halobacteriales archaeon]|nr:methylmalonyl Co-A mutase-associated GTPase MeaB [Halobacteriales archaeon]